MHMMIDFETLDTAPTAKVIAAAVVAFNEGQIINTMLCCFDIDEQPDRTVSDSTVWWWLKQPEVKWAVPTTTVREFCNSVESRWNGYCGEKGSTIWCNGASFDFPILDSLFAQCDKDVPWNFWQQRDCRTLRDFVPRPEWPADLQKHNPLDDCIYQARWVQEAWRTLCNPNNE